MSAGIAPLVRIATRDARRHRARSLLVVAMIALPVAFMVAANVAEATWRTPGSLRVDAALGDADARYGSDSSGGGSGEAEALAALPPGSRVDRVRTLAGALGTGQGPARIGVAIRDIGLGSLAAGGVRATAGRLPAAPDEVAVPAELARGPYALGRTVDLEPLGPRRVVGAVAVVDVRNAGVALVAPGTLPDRGPLGPATLDLYAHLPAGGRVPDEAGWQGRAVWSYGETPDHTTIGLAGAIALLEAGLVAGAALAVGARRRLRAQALVAVAGGTPRQLRAGVLAEGLVLGLCGVVAGVLLGLVAILALRGVVLDEAAYPATALRWPARPLATGIVLGVVAAVLAAVGGARAGTRVPLGRALASRRPPAPALHRRLPLALGVLALGLLLTLLLPDAASASVDPDTWTVMRATTIVLILLGTGLLAPAALELVERAAGRGRGAARLGLRAVSRGRARSVPVLIALAVGVGGMVAVALDQAGSRSEVYLLPAPEDAGAGLLMIAAPFGIEDGRLVELSRADAEAIAGAAVPSTEVAPYVTLPGNATAEDGTSVVLALGTEELAALAGVAVRDDVVVVPGTNGSLPASGRLSVSDDAGVGRVVPAIAEPAGLPLGVDPVALVPPARLADVVGAAAATAKTMWLGRAPAPITRADVVRAQAAAERVGASLFADAIVDTGSRDSSRRDEAAVAAIVLAGTLLLVGIAVALAAAEGADEQRTLMLVGANPGLRRRIAGAEAWTLATVGSLLGIAGGLIAESAYRASLPNGEVGPRAVPWLVLLAIALAVPLVAGLLAAAVTRRSPPWRRLALPRGLSKGDRHLVITTAGRRRGRKLRRGYHQVPVPF